MEQNKGSLTPRKGKSKKRTKNSSKPRSSAKSTPSGTKQKTSCKSASDATSTLGTDKTMPTERELLKVSTPPLQSSEKAVLEEKIVDRQRKSDDKPKEKENDKPVSTKSNEPLSEKPIESDTITRMDITVTTEVKLAENSIYKPSTEQRSKDSADTVTRREDVKVPQRSSAQMTVFETVSNIRPAVIQHITNKRITESINIAKESFSNDTVTAKAKNPSTPRRKGPS